MVADLGRERFQQFAGPGGGEGFDVAAEAVVVERRGNVVGRRGVAEVGPDADGEDQFLGLGPLFVGDADVGCDGQVFEEDGVGRVVMQGRL